MPGRNKPLITRNGIPDPQAYNPQTGQWESFVGVSWGKTAGGLYVPIRVDDQGRQEVTLSGTIPVYNDVLVNAATVPAGGFVTGEIPLDANPWISKILILVNIDKQPWSLQTVSSVGAFWTTYCFYPRRENVTTEYVSLSRPATSVLLPVPLDGAWGLADEAPKSFVEAFSLAFRPAERRVRVFNDSQEVATVTIRAVYVGR